MASNRFLELFLEKLKALIGQSPVAPSQEQVDEAFRQARAVAGGLASGEARQSPKADAPASDTLPPVAAAGAPSGAIRLGEDESEELAPLYGTLRLDTGDGLPEWQPYHRLGNHGVHPRFGEIVFSQKDGDDIIRNHKAGVLGREVPLDLHHGTSLDSEAAGWIQDFRWGKRGEGITAEPSGDGPILYAKVDYTPVGVAKLSTKLYKHTSPEYDRQYQGHGATALALAATNSPFIRFQRNLQGQEPPIVLDDATTQEELTMPEANDPTALHMPPGLAPQPPMGTTSPVPPPRPNVPPAPRPAGAAMGAQPGFAPGSQCPACGTKQAGGEAFCSTCATPSAKQQPLNPPQPPMSFSLQEGNVPEGTVQLDAVALQAQLAESQRRQAALEAQVQANNAVVYELQRDRRSTAINALVDAAIYQGAAPATARMVGALMLAADPNAAAIVRLSDAPDATPISMEAGLQTLLETLPRMPLGRRTHPSLDAPPPSDGVAALDQAYTDAIQAKAKELNAERGIPSR